MHHVTTELSETKMVHSLIYGLCMDCSHVLPSMGGGLVFVRRALVVQTVKHELTEAAKEVFGAP
jgi:hypothetical protein